MFVSFNYTGEPELDLGDMISLPIIYALLTIIENVLSKGILKSV